MNELTEEEIEELRKRYPYNLVAAMRRVKALKAAAKPGNAAWHKLQDEFGYTGDYTPKDEGMHWSDMK